MNNLFSKLTPEQKELAKNCKTKEELQDLIQSDGFGLTLDDLDQVTGGYTSMDCELGIRKGDTRDHLEAGRFSRELAEGRISGADFFA